MRSQGFEEDGSPRPECGHVIPGQDRWAEAEPKTGLLYRLSPKTIGCILALPVAVVLYFFFKNIILPMAETVGDKRAQAVRKEIPSGKTPMQAAKDLAKELSTKTIKAEVTRYIDDEILLSAREGLLRVYSGRQMGLSFCTGKGNLRPRIVPDNGRFRPQERFPLGQPLRADT